jgi:hypothetical protein
MMGYRRSVRFGLDIDPDADRRGDARRLAGAADSAGLDLLAVQDHPYQPHIGVAGIGPFTDGAYVDVESRRTAAAFRRAYPRPHWRPCARPVAALRARRAAAAALRGVTGTNGHSAGAPRPGERRDEEESHDRCPIRCFHLSDQSGSRQNP